MTLSASIATCVSTTSIPALAALSRSVVLIGRLELAMSVVAFKSAAIPVPEPPPVTWIDTSEWAAMYFSAQRWARRTIVSEPLTVRFPASAIDPMLKAAAMMAIAMAAVRGWRMGFFSSFDSLFWAFFRRFLRRQLSAVALEALRTSPDDDDPMTNHRPRL